MTKDNWLEFSHVKSLDDIECFSSKYDNGELSFETVQHEISFLYNIGLFYSEYYESCDIIHVIFRNEDKYYLSVYYYLRAIKLYEENKDVLIDDTYFMHETIRRLYVNIANEFSNQFRSINALAYYRKALEIDEFFDMAIGNFALGIEHHSPLTGLAQDKYSLVFNFIYDLYFELILDNLDSGFDFFKSKKAQYIDTQTSYLNGIERGEDANYDPYAYFTKIATNDDFYEDWCVDNTLYLNFINDLGNFNEAKFDIDLYKLNETLGLTNERLYVLNNLFELYILQRRKIYECKTLKNHETWHELTQVFQCLYSYFDKVAFFIFKYFGLTGKERSVSIHSIWTMKDENENQLLDYKNQYLYDIYWLRKEYRENQKDNMKINELLSPDAQDYADIRNTLEHKEFSFEEIEDLPIIEPNLLYKKTIKLAKVVRNMILSVLQMVRLENRLYDPMTNKRDLGLVYFEFEGFK